MVGIYTLRFLNLMDIVILDLTTSKQDSQNIAEMNQFWLKFNRY
tara:strand:+ start:2797 stop:2928 length:132 start_codon:yes stop_codon:yes gene_type:complete